MQIWGVPGNVFPGSTWLKNQQICSWGHGALWVASPSPHPE